MKAVFGQPVLANPWRLCGMAVAAQLQRCGYGGLVRDACLAHIAEQHATLLWCNARVPAVGFYQRAGLESLGDQFDIPTVGPHYIMARPVDQLIK